MKNFLTAFKVFRVLRSKRFFILILILVLFFLFTPLSLHQLSNKAEAFLNNKAQTGVEKFEQQIGVRIEWRELNFNILTLTVTLKDVQALPLNSLRFKKIQALRMLDGAQTIKFISARPSLYSLLFDKQIVLSKLRFEKGDISLQTLFPLPQGVKQAKIKKLPVHQLLLKDINLNINHRGRDLKLSSVQSKINQRQNGEFQFNFFVQRFFVKQESAPAKNQAVLFPLQNYLNQGQEENFIQLAFKGHAKKNKIYFQNIQINNPAFQALAPKLNIHYNSKSLQSLNIQSSGSLPFSLIRTGFDLLGMDPPLFDSFLSYKVNVKYKRSKGWQGSFDIKGESSVFQSIPFDHFSLKGQWKGWILLVDKGLIETRFQEKIKIKKANLFFKSQPLRFDFSVWLKEFSSPLLTSAVFNWKEFPIQTDFTGAVHCEGTVINSFQCSLDGKSNHLFIKEKEDSTILSFHGMNFQTDMEWREETLTFKLKGEKREFSSLNVQGYYSSSLNKAEADYSFVGILGEDVKLNVPFAMEGKLKIEKGKFTLKDDKISTKGSFVSPLLKMQGYKLKNISSSYILKNDILSFPDIRGLSGKTSYVAECDIDFEKQNLTLKSELPFFDVKNIVEAVRDNITTPDRTGGTGTASFFINYPWTDPDSKEFQLKGSLFNVFINEDFFQQVYFDLGIQNRQGLIRSLFVKKDQGFIKGTGGFDTHLTFDLKLTGRNLSLERMEWLNKILPFSQAGNVNFDMKLTGGPKTPLLRGNILISDMFFYSYPVKNSYLRVRVNTEALSFSGHIIDEIHIENFVYPFAKNSTIKTRGSFSNLDLIKILLSKTRTDKTQNYDSQWTGSFRFSKNRNSDKLWTGLIKTEKLLVSKGRKWIKSEKAFSIFLNEDRWSLTPTSFSHNNKETLFIKARGEKELVLSGGSSLGLFSIFFPFLKEIDGHVQGKLVMDNNLKKINPRGSLQIEKGLFSLDVLPEFTDVRSSLIFSGNNFSIKNLTASAGGGSVKGSGEIFYDFIQPPVVDLKLDFDGAYLDIPKDFKTKTNGKIQIQGQRSPYLISGSCYIESGKITKDFSGRSRKNKYKFAFLDKKTQKKRSLFDLKLNIKTLQAVSVISPLIRSSIEGQAEIYGPADSLLINGQFSLSKVSKENLIFFRGQEFKISSGSILFKNSSPGNPYLNVKAETLFKERIRDSFDKNQEIEREYRIFLSVKGASQKPNFSFESSPHLSEKEIISLLTLGVRTQHFQANVKQDDVENYSYQLLGSLLLEKPLNQEIKNALGLDFRLTPYINTLNKPVTKITLSKNWFEKWKSSFSRTVEDAQSDVRLKYSLNKNISLTGFWENTRQTELETDQEDRLGLDFEFNFNF